MRHVFAYLLLILVSQTVLSPEKPLRIYSYTVMIHPAETLRSSQVYELSKRICRRITDYVNRSSCKVVGHEIQINTTTRLHQDPSKMHALIKFIFDIDDSTFSRPPLRSMITIVDQPVLYQERPWTTLKRLLLLALLVVFVVCATRALSPKTL